MADTAGAGWYDDGTGQKRWWDGQRWTDQVQPEQPREGGIGGFINRVEAESVSGGQPRPAPQGMSYVVLQVILKEKLWGTGFLRRRNFRERKPAFALTLTLP